MTLKREVRIGCLQTRPVASFREATEEALRLAREAVMDGAELVCLPEYCGGLRSEGGLFAPPTAPEDRHPVLAALRGFANEAGVWMLIGSVAIDGPGGRLLNRGYLVDDRGRIRARYDKVHLFDVDLTPTQRYRESAVVAPGGEAVVADTPWGRLGMTICYDLRFPHLYRALAQAGAEILVVPAAFTRTTGEAHWHVLNRARAIENGAVVVSPCAVGEVPGGRRRLRPFPHRVAMGRGPRGRRARGWGTWSPRWTSRAWPRRAGRSPASSTTGPSPIRRPSPPRGRAPPPDHDPGARIPDPPTVSRRGLTAHGGPSQRRAPRSRQRGAEGPVPALAVPDPPDHDARRGRPPDERNDTARTRGRRLRVGRIVTVLSKRPEHSVTMELRHLARRTHDPAERRENRAQASRRASLPGGDRVLRHPHRELRARFGARLGARRSPGMPARLRAIRSAFPAALRGPAPLGAQSPPRSDVLAQPAVQPTAAGGLHHPRLRAGLGAERGGSGSTVSGRLSAP